MRKIVVFGLLALVLSLAACSTPTATPDTMMEEKPTDDMMGEPTDDMMGEPTDDMMEAEPTDDMMEAEPTDDMMEEPADETMMEPPAWFGVTLTDVRTGDAFTIKDYAGKVVLVEAMAIWCPNCKQQQGKVKALHEQLGMRDDFISIGLDIDANEGAEDLKTYVDANGFDWMYVVAPADVSRELGELYGEQFLNPPSTPMLIVDREGNVHPLPFGIKSADDLLKALEPFLNDSM